VNLLDIIRRAEQISRHFGRNAEASQRDELLLYREVLAAIADQGGEVGEMALAALQARPHVRVETRHYEVACERYVRSSDRRRRTKPVEQDGRGDD
jgi:hypothetical protein